MSVQLESISKSFGLTHAVDGVTLAVHPGELFAVLGPSGCGKTTLLRLIAGFERPDRGGVTVGGRRVAGDGVWVAPERRRIGMVFQDYALFPHLTVERNVAFGCRRGDHDGPRRALELVGLQHKADRHPHELSGGERQRVALARALVLRPALIVADEPTAMLDPSVRAGLLELMAELQEAFGIAYLFITHDVAVADSFCRRLVVMAQGEVVEEGLTEDVVGRPTHPAAIALVDAARRLQAAVPA